MAGFNGASAEFFLLSLYKPGILLVPNVIVFCKFMLGCACVLLGFFFLCKQIMLYELCHCVYIQRDA